MELTKFAHSCVRLDDGDRTLVIDPGVFSEVEEALDGADAVIITHEHPDHLDVDRVTTALRQDSRLRLFAPSAVTDQFAQFGGQAVAIAPGETVDAAGFEVRTFGGQHAVIHPTIPIVTNVAVLVGGVYHPGDSLIVPPTPVQTLLVPIHAPWSKVAEVIDFVVGVRPAKVHGIHDGLLNPTGLGMVENHTGRIGGQFGAEYQHLDTRQTVSV